MNVIRKSLVSVVLMSAVVSGCATDKPESASSGTKETAQVEEQGDFGACKRAMLSMTRDPSTTRVPKVHPRETDEDIVFEWIDENRITLQNAKGMELDVSGRCALSKDTRQVAYLLLNGVMAR